MANMHEKRYEVVFTGKYTPGTDKSAVVSNLVLIGIPEEKARALVKRDRAVLKRFSSPSDAQKMVSKLERAGLACIIEETGPAEPVEVDADGDTHGESMLVSVFSKFTPIGKK